MSVASAEAKNRAWSETGSELPPHRSNLKGEDVAMLDQPWESGRSIIAWLGPVYSKFSVPNDPAETREERLLWGLSRLICDLQDMTAARGGNAICQFQCSLDPFAAGTTSMDAMVTAYYLSDPLPKRAPYITLGGVWTDPEAGE